mgnify:CR=1 FL=1
MQNFDYVTPTRLIFGKGMIEKLPEVMAQFGKKILLTYGVNNDADDPQMLELQLKGAVYIDGVNGSDTRDGATPETTAPRRLRRVRNMTATRGI